MGKTSRNNVIDARIRRRFQRRLLGWYQRHGRDLPWRRTTDPYRILVSEIMLHQTQVDRVAPKYQQFVRKYPTAKRLAAAPLREVKKIWYPLGYNYRPRRLRAIARQAVAQYDGQIPDRAEDLMAMEGIGRYTAGAILSFAFQQDAPIVDTNVARLLSRVFGVTGDLHTSRAQKRLWVLAEDIIPKGKGYLINQALMDFGAMVCKPRQPLCTTCTLNPICVSYPWVGRVKRRRVKHD